MLTIPRPQAKGSLTPQGLRDRTSQKLTCYVTYFMFQGALTWNSNNENKLEGGENINYKKGIRFFSDCTPGGDNVYIILPREYNVLYSKK